MSDMLEVIDLECTEIEVHDVEWYQWHEVGPCVADDVATMLFDGVVSLDVMEVIDECHP